MHSHAVQELSNTNNADDGSTTKYLYFISLDALSCNIEGVAMLQIVFVSFPTLLVSIQINEP